MSIDALRERLPPYAKDIAQNLKVLAEETVLNDQQKWGCFLASAYAVGTPGVLGDIEDACELSDEAKSAAKAAAALMAMNNVYYRAMHLMKNPEYATMPARLRMGVIADPGVEKTDFELWCLAVSAVNGCGLCLDSHDEVLRRHAMPGPAVQAALRIASVVNAAGRVVAAEAAAKGEAGATRPQAGSKPDGGSVGQNAGYENIPAAPPTGIPAG